MELMRWWLLTSFIPGTAHELWPPSVRESDCEGTPDDQWNSQGDDCWQSFNPGTAHELWPPSVSHCEGMPADHGMELMRWRLLTSFNPGTAHELWPPSVCESDCEGTPDAHEVTTADELQPWNCTRTLTSKCSWEWPWGDARRPIELMRWRLLTSFNPGTEHELWPQVFVRVTVMGRPTANGICGIAHELWLPSVRKSDCEGTPDDQWSSWGDDC